MNIYELSTVKPQSNVIIVEENEINVFMNLDTSKLDAHAREQVVFNNKSSSQIDKEKYL